jgi:hypothetical protein
MYCHLIKGAETFRARKHLAGKVYCRTYQKGGGYSLEVLVEKYKRFVRDPCNGEVLFFGGFILYIFWKMIRTTMFPYSETVFQTCLILSVVLLAGKIFLFDSYTVKMFMAVAAMLACGLLIAMASGYLWPFIWVLMIAAAKDVPFGKILRVHLLIGAVVVGLAFCASLLGVIENLAYPATDGRGIRYSFGCIYTTDFAAHLFFMLLTAYYLYHKKMRWFHYIGTCVIAGVIYYYCNAKLDTICILLLAAVFGIYHIMRWQREREQIQTSDMEVRNMQLILFKRTKACLTLKKLLGRLAFISLSVVSLAMYLLTSAYREENEFLEAVNLAISGRLMLGKKGLKQFGLSLFGKNVPMEGMGGSLKHTKPYFFIDCSYLFILLRYGILFLGIVCIAYGIICYKRREDTALMLTILLLAVSSAIDQHLLEEAYNPLGYALFAGMGEMSDRKGF